MNKLDRIVEGMIRWRLIQEEDDKLNPAIRGEGAVTDIEGHRKPRMLPLNVLGEGLYYEGFCNYHKGAQALCVGQYIGDSQFIRIDNGELMHYYQPHLSPRFEPQFQVAKSMVTRRYNVF